MQKQKSPSHYNCKIKINHQIREEFTDFSKGMARQILDLLLGVQLIKGSACCTLRSSAVLRLPFPALPPANDKQVRDSRAHPFLWEAGHFPWVVLAQGLPLALSELHAFPPFFSGVRTSSLSGGFPSPYSLISHLHV